MEELAVFPGESVTISIGGGPAVLAHKDQNPAGFQFLMEQIKFTLHHFPTIKKIVLFGHEDCGFYKTLQMDGKNREKRDLPVAVTAIESLVLGVEIVAYYARFTHHKPGIAFEKI